MGSPLRRPDCCEDRIRNSQQIEGLYYYCGDLTLLAFFCISRRTGDIAQRTSAFNTERTF